MLFARFTCCGSCYVCLLGTPRPNPTMHSYCEISYNAQTTSTRCLHIIHIGTEIRYLELTCLTLSSFDYNHAGDKLFIGIQKGFFRLPPQKETPIICIGPGTGVAPIRSLIEQRIHYGSSGKLSTQFCHPRMLI
jgi:hypothetical protein